MHRSATIKPREPMRQSPPNWATLSGAIMHLRCKFRLDSVTRFASQRNLKLTASNQKDGDNKDWSKWSPCGALELTVTNEAAFEQIDKAQIGGCFWIDINAVEPEPVAADNAK